MKMADEHAAYTVERKAAILAAGTCTTGWIAGCVDHGWDGLCRPLARLSG
jgi:hypothetical protein